MKKVLLTILTTSLLVSLSITAIMAMLAIVSIITWDISFIRSDTVDYICTGGYVPRLIFIVCVIVAIRSNYSD